MTIKETKNIKLFEAYTNTFRNGQTIWEALKIVLSLSELSYADSDSDFPCEDASTASIKESKILRRLIIRARSISEDIIRLE